MKCRKLKDSLSAYISEELSERQMSRMSRHLATCSACAGELASFKRLYERIDAVPQVLPSDDFEERFWRKVKDADAGSSSVKALPLFDWTLGFKWGVSVAVAVVVMVGAYFYLHTSYGDKARGKSEIAEMADIDRYLEFYKNYEVIKKMDFLIKLEKDKSLGDNNLPENRTL